MRETGETTEDEMSSAPETMTPDRAAVSTAAAGASATGGKKLRWVAFGAVITAAVMDLLDSTIAQVAAPTIRRELGGSYAVIEWVTAAYALAMAVGLLTGGRLGDIFGRRRVLLTGMAGFVLASAACAAAQSASQLIGARAAQGGYAAAVFGLNGEKKEARSSRSWKECSRDWNKPFRSDSLGTEDFVPVLRNGAVPARPRRTRCRQHPKP